MFTQKKNIMENSIDKLYFIIEDNIVEYYIIL